MIRNLLALIGFLAVAMAGTAGVYATRWGYGDDRPPRLAVSVAGLDLTGYEGQRLLDLRVDAAVRRVCADSASSYAFGRSEEGECRRKARAGAEPQIARAIDRALQRANYVAPGYEYAAAPEAYEAPPEPAPALPEPAPESGYAPAPPPILAAPVVTERHTTIVRTPLRSRVRWVRTKNGLVKKVVRRKLVRKTVKTVYVRS